MFGEKIISECDFMWKEVDNLKNKSKEEQRKFNEKYGLNVNRIEHYSEHSSREYNILELICCSDNFQMLEIAIEMGLDLGLRDSRQENILFDYKRLSLEMIKFLVGCKSELVNDKIGRKYGSRGRNRKDNNLYSVLTYIVANNDYECVHCKCNIFELILFLVNLDNIDLNLVDENGCHIVSDILYLIRNKYSHVDKSNDMQMYMEICGCVFRKLKDCGINLNDVRGRHDMSILSIICWLRLPELLLCYFRYFPKAYIPVDKHMRGFDVEWICDIFVKYGKSDDFRFVVGDVIIDGSNVGTVCEDVGIRKLFIEYGIIVEEVEKVDLEFERYRREWYGEEIKNEI